MQYLGLTLPTPAENLALDEALLLRAEASEGGEVLRLWESPTPAVVLGAGGIVAADVDEAACAADGVPVLRRSSGGGTVLLGPGCLLYTVVLSYDRAAELGQIVPSYCYIFGRLSAALGVPDLHCAGTSDLAVGDRKVSGNAQQRKRTHLLHHGTLLYAFDTSLLGRYLREPARQPEYRARRGHGEFVANLPLGRAEIEHRLRAAFGAGEETAEWPREHVAELVRTKYESPAWTRRR
jgi:lipoate-protein ligase A